MNYIDYQAAFDEFFGLILRHAERLPEDVWREYRSRPRSQQGASRKEVLSESAGIDVQSTSHVIERFPNFDEEFQAFTSFRDHWIYFSPQHGMYYWFGADTGWCLSAGLTEPFEP